MMGNTMAKGLRTAATATSGRTTPERTAPGSTKGNGGAVTGKAAGLCSVSTASLPHGRMTGGMEALIRMRTARATKGSGTMTTSKDTAGGYCTVATAPRSTKGNGGPVTGKAAGLCSVSTASLPHGRVTGGMEALIRMRTARATKGSGTMTASKNADGGYCTVATAPLCTKDGGRTISPVTGRRRMVGMIHKFAGDGSPRCIAPSS